MTFDLTNPFGSFFATYIATAIVTLAAFGWLGWSSRGLNVTLRGCFPRLIIDPLGQITWRTLKSISIAIGLASLIGAVANLEKTAQDMYQPLVRSNLDYQIGQISILLEEIFSQPCPQGSSAPNWCGSRIYIKQMANNSRLGSMMDVDAISRRLSVVEPHAVATDLVRVANNINNDLRLLNEKSAVSTAFKLSWGTFSGVALVIALGLSFGEAVFQLKVEKDKEDERRAEGKRAAQENAARFAVEQNFPRKIRFDPRYGPAFEPPYHP